MNNSDEHEQSCNPHSKSLTRTGKWTIEEEQYTSKLIDAFLSGSLGAVTSHAEDENSFSLRTYLARKLCCRPMRISKKFPGCHYLGVHYQQQVFDADILASLKQTLKSYEMRYLEKDIQVQSQRLKRRKYLKKYDRKKNDRNADNNNNIECESDEENNMTEGNFSETPSVKTSSISQKNIEESFPGTETDPSSSDSMSFYSSDSSSASESVKMESYKTLNKECNAIKKNSDYTNEKDSPTDKHGKQSQEKDHSRLMKEVNNVMMILADAAEIVESKEKNNTNT